MNTCVILIGGILSCWNPAPPPAPIIIQQQVIVAPDPWVYTPLPPVPPSPPSVPLIDPWSEPEQ